jgi:hypothetical protein
MMALLMEGRLTRMRSARKRRASERSDMNVLRALVGIGGLALLGLILWAGFLQVELHGGVIDQFGVIAALPWGVVSLADLYVGFLLFAIVVFLTERSFVTAALWAAPVFLLGNIWAAFWFAIRLPDLARRLAKRD